MKIVLLARALRDAEEIYGFIARDDPSAANSVIARITRSLRLIETNPNIGHPIPGKPSREWSVPGLPYLIPYRVRAGQIEVLRIYHTRRKKPKDWT